MNEELKGLVDTYLKDTNEENKKNLIDSLVSLDKENLKVYIEELKNNVTKKVDLKEESNRISNIISSMDSIKHKREELDKVTKDNNLEVTLTEIPNLSKYNSFINEKKIIDIILNILEKINQSNLEKAKEIFRKKEVKYVLLQHKLINNDSDEEVDKLLESKITNTKPEPKENNVDNNENKIKILDAFYQEKDNFKDLVIPTMGLYNDNNIITIDNNNIFNK